MPSVLLSRLFVTNSFVNNRLDDVFVSFNALNFLKPQTTSVMWNLIKITLTVPVFSSQGLNRVESMGSLGHRTLLTYIENEDLGGLRNFLDSRQIQVDDRDENGTTPLMVAASKGLVLFVKELLSHGADVNAQDLDNWTALICATKAGFMEIVELLVENGAEIEHREMVSNRH